MSHVNVELFESSMQLCISHAIHAETSKHGARVIQKRCSFCCHCGPKGSHIYIIHTHIYIYVYNMNIS